MARKKEEAPQLNDKEKIIDLAMKQIQKEYGEGSIMKLGENQKMNIKSISTGSLNLDIALGVGGVPRGRIIEIYGAESSGKTTLAIHIIAEAQKLGGVAGFIDAELALEKRLMEIAGYGKLACGLLGLKTQIRHGVMT